MVPAGNKPKRLSSVNHNTKNNSSSSSKEVIYRAVSGLFLAGCRLFDTTNILVILPVTGSTSNTKNDFF